MRKAKYDCKRVICKNSSGLGYSSNIAKPGYWIAFKGGSGEQCIGRVLGRIAETDRCGENCRGFLAVMRLSMECTGAGITWVNPVDVTHCYVNPPADLLAWIAGREWVKNEKDILRIIAMADHGTTSQSFIATRADPDKPYNCRPEYVNRFTLP